MRRSSRLGVWEEQPADVEWSDALWAVGVLETADAMRAGRPPRASSALARHVLEVLTAIQTAIENEQTVTISSSIERPPPLQPHDIRRLSAGSESLP